jgi:hypothetical protein
MDLKKLSEPFPPSAISWRVGSTTKDKTKGLAFAYIDARDVQDRLDAVCGPAGWQCSYPHAADKTVCSIGIKIGDEWVWKANGAGDSDIEAQKGALSDAFKRAAVMWGIGRYLYDVKTPWVEITASGNSYKITDAALRQLELMLGAQGGANVRNAPPTPTAPSAPKMTAEEWTERALAEIAGLERVAQVDDWMRANKAALNVLSARDEALFGRISLALKTTEAALAAEGKS